MGNITETSHFEKLLEEIEPIEESGNFKKFKLLNIEIQINYTHNKEIGCIYIKFLKNDEKVIVEDPAITEGDVVHKLVTEVLNNFECSKCGCDMEDGTCPECGGLFCLGDDRYGKG